MPFLDKMAENGQQRKLRNNCNCLFLLLYLLSSNQIHAPCPYVLYIGWMECLLSKDFKMLTSQLPPSQLAKWETRKFQLYPFFGGEWPIDAKKKKKPKEQEVVQDRPWQSLHSGELDSWYIKSELKGMHSW